MKKCVVWKYPIRPGFQTMKLPTGARILSVQPQRGFVQMWALCDPDAPTEDRIILAVGTGQPWEQTEKLEHISTWQEDGETLVFHAFEVTP